MFQSFLKSFLYFDLFYLQHFLNMILYFYNYQIYLNIYLKPLQVLQLFFQRLSQLIAAVSPKRASLETAVRRKKRIAYNEPWPLSI